LDETRPELADSQETDAAPPAADALIPPRVKEIFRRLGPVGPLALIAASLPALGGFALLGVMGWLAPWLREHEGAGIGLYVAGFAILAGLAVLPTYAQSVMGGFAFGALAGSMAALGGIFGAAMIGYVIARRAAGDRVMGLIDEQPKWRAVYDVLIGGSFIKTLLIVTLLRVPHNSPFAITNLVLATTRVHPLAYALGTIIGIAPRTIVAVVIGAGLSSWDLSGARNKWLFVGGIIVTLVVFGIIGTIANRAVQKVTRQNETASDSASCDQ
jgi:uncharacterized membrane protein YdjX (TVP38/TMEM64 family)